MNLSDGQHRFGLERELTWLDEGKQISDQLARQTPVELVNAVADMDRESLEKVVMHQLLRRRFGQE